MASYITVTRGMSGFFAVMVWWNNEHPDLGGFWEPYETDVDRYKTYDEAKSVALVWAESEELEFKETKER